MTPRPRMRVDWRQYFRDFCEKHGDPLTHPSGAVLLFPDGWSYSATSHRGPEWPPPDDPQQHWEQVRLYWRLARLGIRRELVVAREELAGVVAAVQLRSACLTVTTTVRDPDTGAATRVSTPLDPADFRARVAELEADLAGAESKVRACETELLLLRLPRPAGEPTADDAAPTPLQGTPQP